MGIFKEAFDEAIEEEMMKYEGLLEDVYEFTKEIDNSLGYTGKPESLYQTFQMDLLDYCLMIARADGVIRDDEIDEIMKFTKLNITMNDINEIVSRFNAGSDDILRTIPRSFIQITSIVKNTNKDCKTFMKMFIELYGYIGGFISGSDGSPERKELKKVKQYQSLLKTYVKALL